MGSQMEGAGKTGAWGEGQGHPSWKAKATCGKGLGTGAQDPVSQGGSLLSSQ